MTWLHKLSDWLKAAGLPQDSFTAQLDSAALLPAAITRILKHRQGSVLIVVADSLRMERLADSLASLTQLCGEKRPIVSIPELLSTRQQWIPENEAARCAALHSILEGEEAIYLSSASVLLQETLEPESFKKRVFTLRKGQHIGPEELAEKLTLLDYDHEYEVQAPGEFARRGGVFDLYSPLYGEPVRMEFWGNEIDSMRFFSPVEQRSKQEVEELRIIPRGSAVLEPADQPSTALWNYFDKQTWQVFCEEERITRHLQEYYSQEDLRLWQKKRQGSRNHISLQCLDEDFQARSQDNSAYHIFSVSGLAELLAEPLPEINTQDGLWRWQLLRSNLLRWQESGYSLVACCASEGDEKRMRELLAEDEQTSALPIQFQRLSLPAGLFFPMQKLVLLSEQELFGRPATLKRHKHIDYKTESALRDYQDLEEGVLAVHVNHGICRYKGIRKILSSGEYIEALELEFADEAKLYVPIEQVQLLSRYMGSGKTSPALSKLGGNIWKKNLDKAASAAWDLAAEMLKLDALRQNSKGNSFKPAPEWELSFAASFPYIETADQKEAIDDVLKDMESDKPMDRLLCGDVGYGKTEVALRASFRAAMNGRQTAILVPTTLLAQQHYQTFTMRMAPYPMRVELLSRFRSKTEQKQVLKDLAKGEVDIVIGTHRLLQKDVRFASLGLLVIDEEQRFGVKHKQKLKGLRASMDILTMTATPIPRTLYFSISGLRKLSTISTAPSDRMPVSTVVANFDKELIRQVLRRELERGGQSFFLHNRVHTIMDMHSMLCELLPEARIGVGHGQMPAAELEEVMLQFIAGELDVLLCTTIIESGIDIANANTIIIDNAERFGLSELYQLRGRVGRYHRQAYAYMLLQPMGLLPENARQRMAAIRRYSNLGAGFKLALKDMEIRGAGNILGEEQSGHIAAVGFDLYCQMLKEAVAKMDNRSIPTRREVFIELEQVSSSLTPVKGKVQVGIGSEYIEDEALRLETYRRLSQALSISQCDDFALELQDRFGRLPQNARLLVEMQKIKLLAKSLDLISLSVRENLLIIETSQGLYKNYGKLPKIEASNGEEEIRETIRFLQKMQKRK
ncbi:MAG: transcription-repair coupling factor [Lentisphaeria bacterium]